MRKLSCPKCNSGVTLIPRYELLPFMGALWLIIQLAVGNLRCDDCGTIQRQELSDEDLAYVNRVSLWVVGVSVLVLLVPVVIVAANIARDL